MKNYLLNLAISMDQLAELQRAQLPKPYHAAADTPSSTPTTKATP